MGRRLLQTNTERYGNMSVTSVLTTTAVGPRCEPETMLLHPKVQRENQTHGTFKLVFTAWTGLAGPVQ
jgi:hypothetical protein